MTKTFRLEKSNVQDIMYLSPMQEGMLFHYLNDINKHQYLEQLCLTLKGDIDSELIKKSWDYVAHSNEMLRTVYKWDRLEKPIQIVLKNYKTPIQTYNLEHNNSLEKESKAKSIINKAYAEGIDLINAPLRIDVIKKTCNTYELVITYHHIIYDGWSNGILIREFIQACNLYKKNKSPVKKEKNKYKEFIKWCKNQDKQKEEKYWTDFFRSYHTIASLSIRNNSKKNISIDTIKKKLSKETTEDLNKFCRTNNITFATVLYTAWGILLKKYNNANDIVFGTPVSGRNAKILDIENMVGLFINTLPIRIKANGKNSIESVLKKVDEQLKEREEYQNTPLVDIIKYSKIDNSEELFDTLVVIENYPLDKVLNHQSNCVKIEKYAIKEMTNYKLTLSIMDFNGLSLELSYDENSFSKIYLKNLIEHYQNVIKEIIYNAKSSLNKIQMLSPQEKQHILEDFNNTKLEYPKDKTIQGLFEEQVLKSPHKIALICDDKCLTYKQLNDKSNQLARILINRNVNKDCIVGIFMNRSLEMVIGIIAILKAGGAYLPIDSTYPDSRTQYMIEDSGIEILLSQSSLKPKLKTKKQVIMLDDEKIYNGDSTNLEQKSKANNLAYVIYTSGSTGQPKGVMIEHSSLVNFIYSFNNQFQNKISHEDNCLSITNVSFDVSVGEMFLPLLFGARLVLYKENKLKDISSFVNSIVQNNISFTYIPPSILNDVYNELENYKDVLNLSKILVGVEPIKDNMVEQYFTLNKQMEIINGYGPTETTICSTMYKYLNKVPTGENISIGRPIGNTQIYILNEQYNICPVGVAGDIYISGYGLARGYLNRADLSKEKFIDNPFKANGKMYKTGDIAKWTQSGNIYFLGRIDNQAKIRGYRIEFGEIEAKLIEHELINEAVVIAKEDNKNSKYLCAYITSQNNISFSELREHLSKDLPDYMIPSYFIQLDKLPITNNGKIDRKKLPHPDINTVEEGSYEAPTSEIEDKLVSIWEEILSVSNIGINHNFFELGGHSLKLTTLMSRIHKELNVQIPLNIIFNLPTIKNIADYIRTGEKSIYKDILPVEKTEFYEVSSTQKRLYMLQQMDLNSTSYNMTGIFEIEGELDKNRLNHAIKILIDRHESLRTSFQLREEGLVQKIHDEVDFQIEEYQIEYKSEEEKQNTINSLVKAFDLSKSPLLRVGLITFFEPVENRNNVPKNQYQLAEDMKNNKILPEQQHMLLLDMHHIISDGTSVGILVKEFAEIYQGKHLKELKVQYKDYVAWQNRIFKSGKLIEQKEYWTQNLITKNPKSISRDFIVPVLDIPSDYPRPQVQSFEGDSLDILLDDELSKKLKQLSKETGTTQYIIMLSALNVLLSKYSNQEDIIIGSPIVSRPHSDLENIIGMFVNTLAMRNFPKQEKTFGEFLKEVKVNTLRAYENQEYPFEALIEALNISIKRNRNPIFDVMLNVYSSDIEQIVLKKANLKPYKHSSQISKFDFSFVVENLRNKTKIFLLYKTSLYSKNTAQKLLEHYINILKQIVENTSIELEKINIYSEKEAKIIENMTEKDNKQLDAEFDF